MRKSVNIYCILFMGIILLSSCSRQNRFDHNVETKEYYFGIIKSGNKANSLSEDELQNIQKAHLANIKKLADEEKMILAGPFWRENSDNLLRGIFIYTVSSLEEAEKLVNTDPAVIAGRLKVDLFQWVGSKGLQYDKEGGMRSFQAAFFWNNSEKTDVDFDDLYETQALLVDTISDSASIVFAGPFTGEKTAGSPHSFFVYSVDTVTQIDKLAKKMLDKFERQLNATVLDWYGPVGLSE